MVDGTPSIQLTIGLVLEIVFALWGVNNLKKANKLDPVLTENEVYLSK